MLEFFARRRFNYIDMVTMSLVSGFLSKHEWKQAIAAMVIGILFSLKCEEWSGQ